MKKYYAYLLFFSCATFMASAERLYISSSRDITVSIGQWGISPEGKEGLHNPKKYTIKKNTCSYIDLDSTKGKGIFVPNEEGLLSKIYSPYIYISFMEVAARKNFHLAEEPIISFSMSHDQWLKHCKKT